MTNPDVWRIVTMVMIFLNVALVLAFSAHLHTTGVAQYAPVFRWASLYYACSAVMFAVVGYLKFIQLGEPFEWWIPLVLLVNVGIAAGMTGQLRHLPKRDW